jgi:hypothetical protein
MSLGRETSLRLVPGLESGKSERDRRVTRSEEEGKERACRPDHPTRAYFFACRSRIAYAAVKHAARENPNEKKARFTERA